MPTLKPHQCPICRLYHPAGRSGTCEACKAMSKAITAALRWGHMTEDEYNATEAERRQPPRRVVR